MNSVFIPIVKGAGENDLFSLRIPIEMKNGIAFFHDHDHGQIHIIDVFNKIILELLLICNTTFDIRYKTFVDDIPEIKWESIVEILNLLAQFKSEFINLIHLPAFL